MPRFKHTNYDQIKMIPVDFKSQISTGTFEHTLDYLIEEELDLSIFDHRYKNDKAGATAFDPKVLLKIVLLAYSRGITSSRRIEKLCKKNIIFIALSCDSQPHFTTIADFITKLPSEIGTIFKDVLYICDSMDLIGREMFAIDGCKLPSNASKEWSGTCKQFKEKQEKMEGVIQKILKKHRDEDDSDQPPRHDMRKREEKQIKTIKRKVGKYKEWLAENTDRPGKRNNPVQSNITDNESAKMKSSNGVIQGYCGVAIGDEKHQVIVSAEAFGSGDERPTLEPMVEQTRSNLSGTDPFNMAKLSADSGFCSETNLKFLHKNEIDSYVTDLRFRKRNEQFESADRYYPKERTKTKGKFTPVDFVIDPETETCTCPAGKKMWVKSRNAKAGGVPSIRYQAHVADCKQCTFRRRCLRDENQTSSRQFAWFKTHLPEHQAYTKRMKQKIDSEEGKFEYSKRLAIIEPVFGNITSNLGLRRFSLRNKLKVTAQWMAFCLVHNIGKIQRYGMVE
jgi:transposase